MILATSARGLNTSHMSMIRSDHTHTWPARRILSGTRLYEDDDTRSKTSAALEPRSTTRVGRTVLQHVLQPPKKFTPQVRSFVVCELAFTPSKGSRKGFLVRKIQPCGTDEARELACSHQLTKALATKSSGRWCQLFASQLFERRFFKKKEVTSKEAKKFGRCTWSE